MNKINFKAVDYWQYASGETAQGGVQQSVWHYGGGTLEQSAAVRYSSAVPA